MDLKLRLDRSVWILVGFAHLFASSVAIFVSPLFASSVAHLLASSVATCSLHQLFGRLIVIFNRQVVVGKGFLFRLMGVVCFFSVVISDLDAWILVGFAHLFTSSVVNVVLNYLRFNDVA